MQQASGECELKPSPLVQSWSEWEYLACGILVACPLLVVPIVNPCKADIGKPFIERYWVKAQAWLAIFGFIGNYFWTHYFFQLLGASYTMPSHRLNNVCSKPLRKGQSHWAFFCPCCCLSAIHVLLHPVCATWHHTFG